MNMTINETKTSSPLLDHPVVITIRTVQELHWIYLALSAAVHMDGVAESSPRQTFYGQAQTALTPICAKYRS